jgi:hypothetical protein
MHPGDEEWNAYIRGEAPAPDAASQSFESIMGGGAAAPEVAPWADPTQAAGAALASLDVPTPENNSVVPDEVLNAQAPPVWSPQDAQPPAGVPLSQQLDASFPPPEFGAPPPGGSVRTSTTRASSSSGGQVLPGGEFGSYPAYPDDAFIQDMLRPGYEMGIEAGNIREEAQNQQDQLVADTRQQEQNAIYESMAARHAAERRRAEATEQAQQEAKEAWDSIQATNPSRLFHNAGIFGSALMVAGAAMGGWLQVKRGVPNVGLQTVMKMIDNDIQSQLADQENQRAKAYRADRAVENVGKSFDQQFEDIDVQRAARLAGLAKGLEAQAAQYHSDFNRADKLEGAAKLTNEANKLLADQTLRRVDFLQRQKEHEDSVKLQVAARQQAAITAQRNYDLAREEFEYKKGRDDLADQRATAKGPEPMFEPKELAQRSIVMPDTRKPIGYMLSGTPEGVAKVQQDLGSALDVGRKVAKLEWMDKKLGGVSGISALDKTDPEVRAYKALYADVFSQMALLRTGMAMSVEEMKRMQDMLATDTWFTSASGPALNETIDNQYMGINYRLGSLIRDSEGNPTTVDFREARDRERARLGDPTAIPVEPTLTSNIEDVANARSTPERATAGAELVDRVISKDKLAEPQTAAELKKLRDQLAKLPPEQRLVSDADGDYDIVDRLDGLLLAAPVYQGAQKLRQKKKQPMSPEDWKAVQKVMDKVSGW